MHLATLHLTNFRNFRDLRLELPPQGALFKGLNGSGKTNLLEAVHVLCLGRSQRGASRTDMIHTDAQVAHLEGAYHKADGFPQSLSSIGFDREKRVSMQRDGARVGALSEWFGHANVVCFGPDDLSLIAGAPADRRRFMDILISQIDPPYLKHSVDYHRTLANRNRCLAEAADPSLLEIYDEALARHGAYLFSKRAEIISLCQPLYTEFYGAIGGSTERAHLTYNPSFPSENPGMAAWKEVFFGALKARRRRDLEQRVSTLGPHRDTILFFLDGKPVRSYGSQGQKRSMALALRLASVRCIEQHRSEPMIFLVDDAFSELDDARMASVYPLLASRGQVLLTSPLESVPIALDKPRFQVRDATVVRL